MKHGIWVSLLQSRTGPALHLFGPQSHRDKPTTNIDDKSIENLVRYAKVDIYKKKINTEKSYTLQW